MNEPLLAISNVSKSYKTVHGNLQVLKDVSFSVAAGEILTLTGASGVGKSTLLHLMGGLDEVTEGEIRFEKTILSKMGHRQLAKFRNESVGFVFQFHHLLPEFTACENVAMPLLIRKTLQKNKAMKAATDILNIVGMRNRLGHLPAQLSGGEQQRVALARAMVTSPAMVLADEPTGNLDTGTGRLVLELIRNLNERFNVTFVIATHDLELARSSHRWLKMVAGSVALAT
ncbi:ABC transporter ATP-binding protein [bacterium]|nr:ABC transporter ATP-binding protein [bacterium]